MKQCALVCLAAGIIWSGFDTPAVRGASTAEAGCPWPATDAIGRKLPVPSETGPFQSRQFVGIFYFLWHESGMARRSPELNGPYDNSKILEREPRALENPASPLWGGIGVYHYWGEPIYGYYLAQDPWVLRRHAFLLADAGVDALIFDTTNALTYRDVYFALCEVFRQVRAAGGRTPQIAFMVNTQAGETAKKIYEELYAPGKYQELWFYWEGKPLLLCDPKDASQDLRNYFTLRRAHWPFEMTNTANAWHWEATYPQPYGFTTDPEKPEQMNVSAAQNLRATDGKVTNMSFGDARGRSFRDGEQGIAPGSAARGHNFDEQWRRALELRPPFVLVTSWNEWIAGRWGKLDGPLVFVDQMNQEFSRDVEPMKGGHGDNYYLQMVANIRRLKGLGPLPSPAPPHVIDVAESFGQWKDAGTEYRDHTGETDPRDFAGAGGLHYQDRSGRNDLDLARVAYDTENVSFYLRCVGDVRLAESRDLRLYVDSDQEAKTGWIGYDFRVSIGSGGAELERRVDDQWEPVKGVAWRKEGRELQLVIPRRAMNLAGPRLNFDFKWTDHLQAEDPMRFYTDGDVAPEGRFNYRFSGLAAQ